MSATVKSVVWFCRSANTHDSFHSMIVVSVSSPFFRFSWYFCRGGI